MKTTPFGTPAAPAPVTAPAALEAPAPGRRTGTPRPLVLASAGLGALVLVAGAVLVTLGPGSPPVAVPLAAAAPRVMTSPTSTVTPAVAPLGPDGHNPFFALVVAPAAGSGGAPAAGAGAGGSAVESSAGSTAAPTTGPAVGTGAGRTRAAIGPAPTVVRVVPGPTVTRDVPGPAVTREVPGPAVTREVPGPAVTSSASGPVLLTYVGPDPDVPGASRFLVALGGQPEPRSVVPGQAFDRTGPLSWLVYTGPGDDGRAVVTGGMSTYTLVRGTALALT